VEAFWGRGNGNNSSSNSVANRTWRSADFFFALPCSYVSLFFRYIVAPFRAHFLNFLASQKMFIALCGFFVAAASFADRVGNPGSGQNFYGRTESGNDAKQGPFKKLS